MGEASGRNNRGRSCKALTSEYDVKEEKATADVKKFLENLRTKGLLEE